MLLMLMLLDLSWSLGLLEELEQTAVFVALRRIRLEGSPGDEKDAYHMNVMTELVK